MPLFCIITLSQVIRVLQQTGQGRVVQLVEGLSGGCEDREGRVEAGLVTEGDLQGEEEGGEPLVSGQDLAGGGEGGA